MTTPEKVEEVGESQYYTKTIWIQEDYLLNLKRSTTHLNLLAAL